MLRGALILSACACATRAQDRDMSRICVDSDRAACAKYRENSGSWSASNCLSRIDYQEETGVPQEADRNQWGDFFTTDLIQACTDSCSPACSGQTVQATLEVNGPAKEISTYTGRFGTGDREAWAQVELEAGQRYDFVFPGRKPGPTRFRKEGACGRMRLMLVGPDGGSLAARTTGVPVGNTRSTRNAPIENFLARESGTYYLAACEIAHPHEHQHVLCALLSVSVRPFTSCWWCTADDYAGAGEGTVDLAVCTTDRACHHGTDMQHDGTGGAGSGVPPPPPTPTGTWCTMAGYGGNAAVGSLCADTDGDGTPGPCTQAPGDIYGPHGAAHSLALLPCVLRSTYMKCVLVLDSTSPCSQAGATPTKGAGARAHLAAARWPYRRRRRRRRRTSGVAARPSS